MSNQLQLTGYSVNRQNRFQTLGYMHFRTYPRYSNEQHSTSHNITRDYNSERKIAVCGIDFTLSSH